MKLTNKTVPMSVLRVSKLNWKRTVTKEDIDELAGNIAEIGNLHPIIVRPIGKAGNMYEVLAGRRRLEAQKVLGHTKVDVRVVKCDDVRAEIISYSENLKVKRPDSKEWSAGVKKLVDLFEKLYKVGMPTKSNSPKKSTRSVGFSVAATLNPPELEETPEKNVGGRPGTPKSQAIKDAAKSIGASEASVRKAVRREEDLIPSAARALEQKLITQDQADILASMSKKKQQQELINMVRETREETRRRRNVEKVRDMEDRMPVIIDMLASVFLDCAEIQDKLSIALSTMDGAEIDINQISKLPNYKQVEKVRDSLNSLLEFTEG